MAMLFIRIELNGDPDRDTYDELHAYMGNLGWSRGAIGDDGIFAHDLPTATYTGESDVLPALIADELHTYITNHIWDTAIVLVIEANSWAIQHD